MGGTFELSGQADADLVGLWSYLEGTAGERAADKVLDALAGKFALLADNPGMGRPRDELGTGVRSFPVKPYVVFYQAAGPSRIRIVRLLHQRQDVDAAFNR